MDKVARPAPGEVQTGKKGRRTAYLIAVRHKRDLPRIYALFAPSAEAALAQLNELTTEGMGIEVVGALSRDLARRLGLKAGEIRLV
ncbi:hypothetical protein [Methylobacterium sp. J-090]|uniref:hypothetical protein n=1 Tax=Methylobacterium sp. J-090 TaxID=2836666 RepID=UPI001FBBCF1A|nr:hypothetical protein [Methylobacterium sp. J-090]MCJ2084168.1 hypothetical protein [Methylobacterium sp. J-090]